MIRRLLAATGLIALAVLTTAVVSAPAAQAVPYPPHIRVPIVSATSYDPCAGASNTIGGRGFVPGETVRLTLSSFGEIGRAVIGEDSSFQITVTIPLAARGNSQVTVTGLSSGRVARLMLAIPCVVNDPDNGGSGAEGTGDNRGDGSGNGSGNGGSGADGTAFGNGSGSLASTGAAVGGVLLLGAVLVGAGGLLTVASRRRRGTSG